MGHIVSEHGIEVDSEKIIAILDMPALRIEREVKGFLGRLHYISHFIARLIDICEPNFHLLRKNQHIVWNDDCQHAFKNINECLLSPLILVLPTPGRPLLLYLLVLDMAEIGQRSFLLHYGHITHHFAHLQWLLSFRWCMTWKLSCLLR